MAVESIEKTDLRISDSSLLQHFKDLLEDIIQEAGYQKVWGIDLRGTQQRRVDVVLGKFLDANAIPIELQLSRSRKALTDYLKWRKQIPDLDESMQSIVTELCRISETSSGLVAWYLLHEKFLKGLASNIPEFYRRSWHELSVASIELVVDRLFSLDQIASQGGQSASFVIDCYPLDSVQSRHSQVPFRGQLIFALREIVPDLPRYYPGLLRKLYLVNMPQQIILDLSIPASTFCKTQIVMDSDALATALGIKVPKPVNDQGFRVYRERDKPKDRPSSNTKSLVTGPDTEEICSTNDDSKTAPESEPRLIYSEKLGKPSYVLDPDWLTGCWDLCPDKMGARIVLSDENTVVKYGHGVRLAEAEAMRFATENTAVQAPSVDVAYELDGVGYIVMSYEKGKPLEVAWKEASESQRESIIAQLREYVSQMRALKGTFIGGLDHTPCKDGIFDADWGDTRHDYGPYESESAFNEGIVQALRNRSPPQFRPKDPESSAWNRDFILEQTVRALRGHEIVFTHGDLHSTNILIRESDGKVVLLDWGLAGYWPDYWEHYRAMFLPPFEPSWDREVARFVHPSFVEIMIIQKVFSILWN